MRSRLWVLFICGLFLFSFSSTFVSANVSANEFTDDIREFITGIADLIVNPVVETSRVSFAQVLMIFIIVMLIYSILEFLPIFPATTAGKTKGWIQWGVAIASGLLAFLFIDSETVIALTYQYEAMGVILTSVIPALIILAFTWKIQEKVLTGERASGVNIFSPIVLFGFGVYLLIRSYSSLSEISGVGLLINNIVGWTMIVLAFGERKLVKIMTKKAFGEALESERSSVVSDQVTRLNNEIQELERRFSNAKTQNVKASIRSNIDMKKQNIKELQRMH